MALEAPFPSTLLAVSSSYRPQKDLQRPCQVPLKDKTGTFKVTVQLMSLVTKLMTEDNEGTSVVRLTAANCDWALSSFCRLWSATSQEGAQLSNASMPFACHDKLLDTIRDLFLSLVKDKPECRLGARCSMLLCQITSAYLTLGELPFSDPVEKSLCFNIIQFISNTLGSQHQQATLREYMLPGLKQVNGDQVRSGSFSEDLKLAVSLVLYLYDGKWEAVPPLLHEEGMPHFQDVELQRVVQKHFCIQSTGRLFDGASRPSKRARLSTLHDGVHDLDSHSQIVQDIYTTLGLDESTEVVGIGKIALDCYPRLSEEGQCLLFDLLGRLACASAGNGDASLFRFRGAKRHGKCAFCDADARTRSSPVAWEGIESEEMLTLVANLFRLPKIQKSRQPRVAAVMALGRLISHTANPDNLSLTSSPFGQWCLQSLHSSLRELRIAAGRTMSVFLRDTLVDSPAPENRVLALDFLRNLSDQGDLALQETCILTWGQVARNVADGDEMNLVLLKLVEYLGHTNSLICGLAYDELQRISNHSPFSAMKLFAPYWHTVAVTVVQDLHRRPQIAQQMSDLLAMSVPNFLSLTQVYTIPFLVLTKQQDVLQRIADSCNKSIMVLCREHNNLAAILSSVLLQSPSKGESLVMTLLKSASPEFDSVDCAELLKSEPQATATQLLKSAGEDDQVKRPKVMFPFRG